MSSSSLWLWLLVLAASLLIGYAQMDFDAHSAYDDVDLYATPSPLYFDAEAADAHSPSFSSSTFSLYGGKQQVTLPTLTRPALFKQRPTVIERVAIPVLLSSTRTTKAAPLVQKALTEQRPTVVQAVKPHSTFQQLQPLTEAAQVPFLQSSTTTQKAAPIMQKALQETRPELVQAVEAHPSKEQRPTVTEAVQVPFMQSSEQTTKAAPIEQQTLIVVRPDIVQEAPATQKK